MTKIRHLPVVMLAVANMLGLASPAISDPAGAAPIPGVHYIRPAHASNKCVTVHGWDTSTRAKIDQWTCQGQQNQRWSFIDNGYFRYWVKSESSNKCLDGGDLKKGRKVMQWPCHSSGLNQSWHPVSRGGNTYSIHVGTKCLDVEGGSKSNGARLILWKCKNVSNQRFYLQ
ncbi:RICIN domain-containing protein [Streptomyces sp. NPDC004647]|uniref:RICIN domain-containing protein n=1 Tax=Streptomyces sp. NPDC004647 TaxID=3154671 RepID=UPI0033A99A8F